MKLKIDEIRSKQKITNKRELLSRKFIRNQLIRLGGKKKLERGDNIYDAKYYISADYEDRKITIDCCHATVPIGVIFFDSREKLEEAIKIIGKEKIEASIF